MELFTILYAFMWIKLNLRGAAKEVFAVIFGFWQVKKEPVMISNKIIHSITGLSHATIVKSKNLLIKRNLILVHEIRWKPSTYEVVLPEDGSIVWTRPKYTSDSSTKKTGLEATPKKEISNKVEKKNKNGNRNQSIDVGDQGEFELPDQI